MTKRTTEKTVTFSKPFVLSSHPEELPAGSYDIEMDDELIENLSFSAYRRVLTLMHLPPTRRRPGVSETITIDHRELDEALDRDQAP